MHHLDGNWKQQTVERIQRGDKAAFDLVYYAYEARLFAFALKLTHNPDDAKEVVQEVFLKVWERRELLEPQGNFEGFIFTIAKNIVYNKARHRVYEMAYKKYLSHSADPSASVTEEMLEFRELERLIRSACEELPPMRRKVFLLSRMEGFSHNEIAEKLNTSTSNIKNQIYKAMIFLKEHLRTNNVVRVILALCTFCMP